MPHDGGDRAALKNQHNKGRHVKWRKRMRDRKKQRERYGRKHERTARTIAPYSTLAVDVKHPSHSQ